MTAFGLLSASTCAMPITLCDVASAQSVAPSLTCKVTPADDSDGKDDQQNSPTWRHLNGDNRVWYIDAICDKVWRVTGGGFNFDKPHQNPEQDYVWSVVGSVAEDYNLPDPDRWRCVASYRGPQTPPPKPGRLWCHAVCCQLWP
jgi:hypothetical protein